MHKETKQMYGLGTAIAMIVGVVIGSGIYFKADDILYYTNGNVALGICVILFGAITIIFGSLSLSELAHQTCKGGGISSYFDKFIHPKWATGIAFYQAYVYLPSFTVIVAWVAASYTFTFMRVEGTVSQKMVVGIFYIVAIMVMNSCSKRLAGWFQSATSIIKILPLIIIAIAGLIWTQSLPPLPENAIAMEMHMMKFGWIAAIIPLTFAFEGWNVVATIAPEVKNSRRNLPIAMIVGPLIIVTLYVAYFYGINRILGADFILAVGNDAIAHAAGALFGPWMSQLIVLFVIISVLGVLNGYIFAQIRMIQTVVEHKIGVPKCFHRDSSYLHLSSANWISMLVITIWLVIHFILTTYHVLPGSDMSESTLLFNNVSLLPLFIVVLKMYRQKIITHRLTGLIAPIVASFGIFVIILGSLFQNPANTIISLALSGGVMWAGKIAYERA